MTSVKRFPSKQEIWNLFTKLSEGDNAAFFSRVAPNVDWVIMGTSPMSKRYDSLEAFQKETLGRLKPILKAPGLILKVHNVVGGDDEWATAELKADAECVNGQSYKMSYAWVIRFEPDSQMIVQVRAYLDTNLLTRTLQDHEAPVYSAPREF